MNVFFRWNNLMAGSCFMPPPLLLLPLLLLLLWLDVDF
jgi:hypothetical protein